MKSALSLLVCFMASVLAAEISEKQVVDNKKFQEKGLKKHPNITLTIDSLSIGPHTFNVNFHHSSKIKTQTGLLKINDTIGVNVIFLKVKTLNTYDYFYSHTFYRKGYTGDWESVSDPQFYRLILGSYVNGWGGINNRGEAHSFWYKMYCKFH
jgi:hypothetical protein